MKLLRVLAVLLAALLLLSACGESKSDEAEPAPEAEVQAEESEEEAVEEPSPTPEEPEDSKEEPPEEPKPQEQPKETPPAEPSAPPEEETLGAMPDQVLPPPDEPAVITVLSPQASGTRVESDGGAVMDYSHCEDGYIMVAWFGGSSPPLKLLLTGPSQTTYQYDLNTEGYYETFPLSDGNGIYEVAVYQNVSGTSYATVFTSTLSVELTDQFAAFLRPNQYINFTAESEAVKKAAQLCAGRHDNLEKVAAVYDYVVQNVTYDSAKAQTVTSGYLPDVDDTLLSGKGICFDYAALMAAMLRSQGVPVKLIVGYTGSIYHAWINVWSESEGWMDAMIYFNGSEWKLMDPTFASNGQQSADIMQYIGNGANYTAKYQY